MKLFTRRIINLLIAAVVAISSVSAQNPIIRNQFSADPTARVFEGKVYLFPSHDILAQDGKGRAGWFCMEDYHVFSSSNLTDWTDHGVVVSQETVPWANHQGYAMWAPDCIEKNGKYYFYFPAPASDPSMGRGFAVGVAVADKPSGPYTALDQPIKGVRGIDPNVFIDSDGQAYLLWAARNFFIAKLKDNMTELATEPVAIDGLPEKGLKEGPFLFSRNGKYYLTYPHVADSTEQLEYAMSDSLFGPYHVTGVIMDASRTCWTNHQSIIQYHDQWYLFYHRNDLSPHFDKNRSVRIDSLFFNPDGTIQKVMPTLRGVGVTDASSEIQIDRYSRKSDSGTSVEFIDTSNTFGGWETVFDAPNAWIQYNAVDFGNKGFKTVKIRTHSRSGGTLQIRLGNEKGPIIADINISNGDNWRTVNAPVTGLTSGIQNLVVQSKNGDEVSVDWLQFK